MIENLDVAEAGLEGHNWPMSIPISIRRSVRLAQDTARF